MPQTPQTYANHTRFVPLYHGFVLLTLTLNLGWAITQAVQSLSFGTVVGVLVAVALAVLAIFARTFALRVQDRVIRLEMRLRLKEVLPASMHARLNDFSIAQLVALRFASDGELPALAEKVLRDDLQDKKAIKQLVKSWQGDYARA